MRRRFQVAIPSFPITTLLVLVVAVVVMLAPEPASAVNVPGCGEFILFAEDRMSFEQGPTLLTGNVFLANPNGTVSVGAHNVIHGTVTAHKIFLGTDAVVDICIADIVAGPGKCGNAVPGPIPPFNPPGACTNSFPPPPLMSPNVPDCVNTGANVTVPGAPLSLTPNCYGSLRVKNGATLTLTSGQTYNFKDVLIEQGATLKGSIVGTSAIVNVKGLVRTEPSANLNDLLVNVQASAGAVVALGNNAILTNVVFNAPNGLIHPRSGTQLRGDSAARG